LHNAKLRKVGGSVMLAVPPPILDLLRLRAGATVGVDVDRGRLVVEPQRLRYTLDELLAQCRGSARRTAKDRQWLDAKPTGGELP
jgi:antitoxin ChpS